MFKSFIQKKIEKYAKKYLVKHKPKIVLVTGSVGKTTTKLAIATMLSQKYRIRVHKGNHNTHMSVPLAIMGIDYPDNIRSLGAWLTVRRAALMRIHNQISDCDVIVQELGTDTPGDVAYFGNYLHADIAVVTAVSPAHMEFFGTEDAVAQEELSVSGFADLTLINRDDIAGEYAKYISTPTINTYGLGGVAEYRFLVENKELGTISGKFVAPNVGEIPTQLHVVSDSGVKAAVAAGFVGLRFGLSPEQIINGFQAIAPPPGRMNILRGQKHSAIIDDSYNSSPLAAINALECLYQQQAPQRILIFGDMNELGESSAIEHEKIGKMCDPDLIQWVISIGTQSEQYFAPAARARGCQVKSFSDPTSAGAFAHSILEEGALVLVKGSQNGVFAEEAVKMLLHDTRDEQKLVRQSAAWLSIKHKQFVKF